MKPVPSRAIGRILLALAAVLVIAGAAHAQTLYWTSTAYGTPTLNRSNDNGTGLTSVALTPGTLPEGLAVDPTFAKVYWTEASWSGARLNQGWFDLSGGAPILTGLSACRGLTVDAADQSIYWTSSNLAVGGRINKVKEDGTNAQVLIQLTSAANPRGIVVDHAANRIYWVDFDQSLIVRANLDGTNMTTVLALNLFAGAYGLALDPVNQFLYWTEFNTGLLRRATTAGAGTTTIFSGLANPTYLTLDLVQNRVFWIESLPTAPKIRRGSTGGGPITTVTAVSSYGGIAYVSGGTASTPETEAPLAFAIERVWPSPSTGPVHVAFTLPRDAEARLSVLDLQGREIAVLTSGVLPAGRHEPVWDPARSEHSPHAGVYFVRLVSEGRSIVRRVALAG
jgi:DNA-binding beta-propeller fold protein YncE